MDTLEKQCEVRENHVERNDSNFMHGYKDTQTWLLDPEQSKIYYSEKIINNNYRKGCISAICSIIKNSSDQNKYYDGHDKNPKMKTITFSNIKEINKFFDQQRQFLSAMKQLGYNNRVRTDNPEGPLIQFFKPIRGNKNINSILQNFVSILNKNATFRYLKEKIDRYSPESNKT